MLEAAMAALAASGGAAVVQAAGTDAWAALRDQVGRWFGRGDEQRERVELERLETTAAALRAVEVDAAGRIRLEASWQARFETLLENLSDHDRARAAAELQALLDEHAAVAGGGTSAGAGGLVVGGNIDIRADHGSAAAGVINGQVSITNPSMPAPPQG